jgi:6-phosphogluconolactonase (cycloisomerase 2 family)
MISRRAFGGLFAGAFAMPDASRGQTPKPKTVFYASIGPELILFDIDVEGATLTKRGAVKLPANIQYAWPHPSRRFLYVVSSNGAPGFAGDKHYASALAVDPATGALTLLGDPAALVSRPIHTSVDATGVYLLIAHNNPSNISVLRLNADGTLGAPVAQPGKLDTGIFAHQVRAMPSNRAVTLVTRGNDATATKVEDPGAIHVHPSGKFVYVTNRASDVVEVDGKKIVPDGENNIAVFAINQDTGEPTLIQNADGRAVELRTFGIEPSGRMLVTASIKAVPVRDGASIGTLPAKLDVFRIGGDGKLDMARQYHVDTGALTQFWSGMITLA